MPISVTVEKLIIGCGLALVLSTGLGCARASHSDELTPTNEYAFDTPAELQKALSAYTLSCDGPCPENAGSLIIADDDLHLTTCTFSLVGPDIILTNRHCVPDTLAKPGANCRGKIQAVFATSLGQQTFACKKVLSVPGEYDLNPTSILQSDYAFIQLEKSPGKSALPISTAGVQQKEMLTILTATPVKSKNGPAAVMGRKYCQIAMNTAMDPDFTNETAPVVVLKNCDVVHGNSGAAAIDSKGAVKVVIHAFSDPAKQPAHPENTIGGKKTALAILDQYAHGTNMACVQNSELKLTPASSCSAQSRSAYGSDPATYGYNGAREKNAVKNQFLAAAPDLAELEFEIQQTNSTDDLAPLIQVPTFSLVPACLKGSAGKIPWLQKYGTTTNGQIHYPEFAPLQFQQLEIEFSRDLDRDAHFFVRKVIRHNTVRLILPLRKLAEGHTGPISILGTIQASAAPHRMSDFQIDLEMCSH